MDQSPTKHKILHNPSALRSISNPSQSSIANPPVRISQKPTAQKTKMFPTRALFSRSVWKGPNIVPLPLPRKLPAPPGTPPIKTQKRGATILPNFVGLKFQVHNGKVYQDVVITEEMVGRKLGEFVATRKRFTYKQSKNK
ncbi:mitochondrial ribosomal small subunit component [Aspergillus tubingensis]|nr:ribosomal protein S19/S15 [Aspergillus tubingensis]GFN10389.1 ribosomal protein S19/S15 [Aspergillus tubingensis]